MRDRPKILMTMRADGENGGPYVSHKKILESKLNNKYEFKPLMIPRIRQLLNPFGMYKLIREIRRERPDIVQIAGLQPEGFFSMLACKIAGVKTVLAIHGSSSEALCIGNFRRKISCLAEKKTVESAAIVYGVSDYVSSWDICKLSKRYYGTIYNIPRHPSASNGSLRKDLLFSDDDIIVVSTGRIVKEKGYDILWDVIRKINDNNVKFVIAGEGDYKSEFERLIEMNGYGNKVFLLGYLSDVSYVLNDADIFVICTKHETLCISLLEAAYAGLPLVATRVGGIPEIIQDSVNGFLVENMDADGFAEALRKLIKDKPLRVEMGKRALETINEKFDEEIIISKLDEMYQQILYDI